MREKARPVLLVMQILAIPTGMIRICTCAIIPQLSADKTKACAIIQTAVR